MGWFDDNGFGDPSGGNTGVTWGGAPVPVQTPEMSGAGLRTWLNAGQPTSSAGPAGTAPYDPTQAITEPGWTTGYNPNAGPAGQAPMGGGGNLSPSYANAGQQMPAGLQPPPYTGDPQAYVEQLKQQLQSAGISPKQEDPTAINYIVSALRKAGVPATPVGNDKFTDGISINGQPGFKLISGQNGWLPGFQTYAQAEGGGSGGGFGSLNFDGSGGTFNAPSPFQAPSLEDARNSPGYQFALEQGMKGIQNSAAAKGTLLTGGTLKSLQGYGTGLADQTYGNVFNRALSVNQNTFNQGLRANETNFGQGKAIHDTRYGDLYQLAQLGKPS